MSLLKRAIDYVDRALTQPIPAGHPPKDDLAIALAAWTVLLLCIAITAGKACSN